MSYIGNTTQNQNYVPAVDFFSGNGSTTAFTLSRPVASVAAIQAVISNVPQDPGTAFTVSGSTITFTSAPPSGTNNIYVYYTSPNTQVVQPGQGTVGTTQLAGGTVVTTADATINGLTVGKGGGAVGSNTVVGGAALASNTTGFGNTGVGYYAMNLNTGSLNSAFGLSALQANTSGNSNSAFGYQALTSNTTASNNTAVGYQAGYSVSTSADNAFFGRNSGQNTTSRGNTFIGATSGYYVTSGAANTILGAYNGNQSGLDIRTANNNIVLSDGDGIPRQFSTADGIWLYGNSNGALKATAQTQRLPGSGAAFDVFKASFSDNYSTALVQISIAGMGISGGVCYFTGQRYIKLNGGSITATTLGTDVSNGVSISFTYVATDSWKLTVTNGVGTTAAMTISMDILAGGGGDGQIGTITSVVPL